MTTRKSTTGTRPRALVAARALVDGSIHLERGPATFEATAGEPLAVTFVYRVFEASLQQEDWTFRLEARIGDGPLRVQERRHEDRPYRPDGAWAVLEEEFALQPGEHVLAFAVQATATRRPWRGAGEGHQEQRRLEGTVIVRAGAGPRGA